MNRTWQGSPKRIAELRAMLARVRDADDSQLDSIYVDWIGYPPMAESGDSAEETRSNLRDYVAEICYAEGIHCSEVFEEGE